MPARDLQYQITVRKDKLLARLFVVHNEPRKDIPPELEGFERRRHRAEWKAR